MKKKSTSQLACRAVSTPCREEDEARLLVVQFSHPGGEYKRSHFEESKDKTLWKPWSDIFTKSHQRSFIQCNGAYLDDDNNKKPVPDLLNFWGEWEGPADVKPLTPVTDDEPKWLLTPRYPKKSDSGMNTDPFVFNGPFRYSFCRQERYVCLRDLAVGSMVLFGSSKGKKFVLDTVFVVGKNCGTIESHSNKKSLGLFWEMNINAIFKESRAGQCGGNVDGDLSQYTVYEGATQDFPVNGIYSFVPAKRESDKDSQFKRPVLTREMFGEIISPRPPVAIKKTTASKEYIAEKWNALKKYLLDEGFVLGVRFEINP